MGHFSGLRVHQDLEHQFRVADNPKTAPAVPIEFETHASSLLP
jgi:hypothetical protein